VGMGMACGLLRFPPAGFDLILEIGQFCLKLLLQIMMMTLTQYLWRK
jgi:hypothetical protein